MASKYEWYTQNIRWPTSVSSTYIVCVMASNEMLCMFLACHMILAVLVQLEIVEIALVKTETPKSVLPFPMQCFIIHIIIYPTIFFTKLRCRSLLHSQLRCFQSKNWFM